MTLGEKLRAARVEAGLSQRALCGNRITRNMLSQIENGSAKPSMDTLCFLAGRLQKPVSWFLEEPEEQLTNLDVLKQCRECFRQGAYSRILETLKNWKAPDPVLDPERQILEECALLHLGEQAIQDARFPYALELLLRAERVEAQCIYGSMLTRKRLVLLGKLPAQSSAGILEGLQTRELEEELLVLGALESDANRGAGYLDAVQNRSEAWNLLRGRLEMRRGNHAQAAKYLEGVSGEEASRLLEACYEAMGDYRRAYALAKERR